ncbi:amidohydrolase family protein [Harryflintia acetispora]|uniref:Amidohydrolase-related domain-containing protein n=2 Tax=Harryflintia acetispora TaxID=1849041 RepID=A0A9X8UL16_9FIRM|nr:amidohydrolase family protein [Harryflintia acetispora]TCL44752.1 hypothetical protein EDD78_102378 [Harryflintia acetispora]
MVIDVHTHAEFMEPMYKGDEVTRQRKEIMGREFLGYSDISMALFQMDHAGIDKRVLLPLDLTTQYGCTIVSNDEMKKLVGEAPERFIGFASVDPYREDAIKELDHAFGELGLSGLKLNPSKQKFYPTDSIMKPVYEKCIEYGKPILFHCGTSWEPNTPAKYSKPLCFEEVAIEYPELRIGLAHFGWPWVQDTAMMLLKYPNVYADTSMLYCDRAKDFFHQIFKVDLSPLWIENMFSDKVMFGSNSPRFGEEDMKYGLEKLGLRERTLAKVLGGNAMKFLGMED